MDTAKRRSGISAIDTLRRLSFLLLSSPVIEAAAAKIRRGEVIKRPFSRPGSPENADVNHDTGCFA